MSGKNSSGKFSKKNNLNISNVLNQCWNFYVIFKLSFFNRFICLLKKLYIGAGERCYNYLKNLDFQS